MIDRLDRQNLLMVGLWLLIIALVIVAYQPALDAGFYFDDEANILDAAGIHWTTLEPERFLDLYRATELPRRWVVNLSFAVNHLVGGLNPTGYHLANVVIHLLTGVALAWTITLVFHAADTPRNWRPRAPLSAVVVSGLFLVHPLNSQAVTYVVQRMTSMAALFVLCAFASYITARQQTGIRRRMAWFTLAGTLWILAVGAKETALALPLVIATYEFCFRREEWRQRLSRIRSDRRRATGAVAIVILGVVFLGMSQSLYVNENTFGLTKRWENRDFSGVERTLTQSRVQIFYLGLVLWPSPNRLNLDHDYSISYGLLDPPMTAVAVAFWAVVAAAAIVLAVKLPRFGFPLLAYLEFHLIESGPINLELVFEHRMYLPMTMLALLGAAVACAIPWRIYRVGMPIAVALLVSMSLATRQRNLVWGDSIAFHFDCARKSPNKFRPQYNLGTELGSVGRVSEALPYLEKAVDLNPSHSAAHNQLGNALLLSSRTAEAFEHYRIAVQFDQRNAEAVYNLAMMHEQRGDLVEAERLYRRFIEIAPRSLSIQVEAVRSRVIEIERRTQ